MGGGYRSKKGSDSIVNLLLGDNVSTACTVDVNVSYVRRMTDSRTLDYTVRRLQCRKSSYMYRCWLAYWDSDGLTGVASSWRRSDYEQYFNSPPLTKNTSIL